MKKYLIFAASVLAFLSCDPGNKHNRIDQIDESIPAPQPVTISEVRNTMGGAVIKVKLPDDDVIRGVIASYVRNGEEVNTKISRYVDSLVVEGFASEDPQTIHVCSFNVNEVKSAPVDVEIRPLTPTIKTVKAQIVESFGGVKVHVTGNDNKSNMAVCLLRCEDLNDFDKPVKDIKWVEVTTLFTASNDIFLTRRGLPPTTAIYGSYFRDRWGNISDTVKFVLTPIEEYEILKKMKEAGLSPNTFKSPCPPASDDDNTAQNNGTYPVTGLWDGSGASEAGKFFNAREPSPRPCWITIDLGHEVQISRIHTLPRIGYNIWRDAHPRCFEFWGSLNPTGEPGPQKHDFDETWMLLGEFEQFKPSGYQPDGSVGEITQEDSEYFNSGNDFEMDINVYPHANDVIRYLRIVFVDNFATYGTNSETMYVQFGEVTPFGKIVSLPED